jgi:hypothetical protein
MITAFVSKNHLPLSWLIRKMSGEPASHFGICFDDRLVFHSTFSGAHPSFKKTFLKKNSIVWEIKIPATYEQEEEIFQKCLEFDGARYDFMALIYDGLSMLNKILFHVREPKKNEWNQKNEYLCCEVAETLSPVLPIEWDVSADTPWGVINKINLAVKSNPDTIN